MTELFQLQSRANLPISGHVQGQAGWGWSTWGSGRCPAQGRGLELEDFNIPTIPNQTMIPWQGENMAPGLHVCIYHSHPENVSPSTTAIYQYQLLNKLSRALCPGFQLQLTGQTSFWFLNPWKKWAAAHPQKKMASSSWKNFFKKWQKKKNPIFKGKSLETSGLLKILSHKEEKFVPTLQIRSICVFSENQTFLSRCRFRIKQCHRPCS